MKINWQRLLATSGIVVVTAAVLGYLTWTGLTKIISENEAEVSLLSNRSSELSQLYLKKSQEKKAEEAKKSEAAKKTTGTTSRNQDTSSSGETDSQEQTTAQSQIFFFFNPSCGACNAQKPIVYELQGEGVPFAFCDVVANPSYIGQYGITAVPTFILNGHRKTGVFSKAELLNFWNTYK